MAPEAAPDDHQHEAEIDRFVAKQAPQHGEGEHHERIAREARQQRLIDAGGPRVALRPQKPAVDEYHQHADDGRAQQDHE